MNTKMSTIPGYRLNEYQLVLNPPVAFREKINRVREEFREIYPGSQVSTRPYLVLVRFTAWEMMEEKITLRLKTVGMGAAAFKLQVKDFGSFPSHSLFINVITKLPVQDLVRQIRTAQRLLKSPDSEPHFLQEPHFSIATRLIPAYYEKAWLEYSHRHFTASFIVDSMLLLKKKTGEKRFEIVENFSFMNLPVSSTQGALF
ncbi:MAG TPA: 2'-5' RNA ligase family protein [Flavitalea sp.]|nr:2'-5' RNA ligase family protein [Flavitalea sp.]